MTKAKLLRIEIEETKKELAKVKKETLRLYKEMEEIKEERKTLTDKVEKMVYGIMLDQTKEEFTKSHLEETELEIHLGGLLDEELIIGA